MTQAPGRLLKSAAIVALATALITGCSSSKPGTGSTAASSTSSSARPSTSASPASQAQLDKIVLQPSELPAGWKATPYEADPEEATYAAELASCLGVPNTDPDKVATANSPDFDLGDARISSSASSFRTQSAVDTDTAVANSPKVPPCYEKLLKQQVTKSLPTGASLESVTFTVTPRPAGLPADVIVTGMGTIKISAGGRETVLYLSIAHIAGPMLEASVNAQNIGSPVPADLFTSLVTKMANRIPHA